MGALWPVRAIAHIERIWKSSRRTDFSPQPIHPANPVKYRNLLPLLALIAFTLATESAIAATGTWSGAATGTWDTTATNWTGVSGTPWDSTNGLTDPAVFNTASLAAVVSGTVNTNGITFNASGSLSNGVINLAGTTPLINVASSMTGTVNSVLTAAAGLTKSGTGTLILTASNTYTGATTISAGTLQIGNGANATAGAGTGVLAVGANTLLLNFNGPVTLANSSITSATSTATIQNNGSAKVTINNAAALAGTINGGSAGIVLNTTLTGASWNTTGDVTLSFNGSGSLLPNSPGTTWHILANSSCWQIGGSAANPMTLDLASGVTLAASSGQGGGAHYFNNLTGAGSFQAVGNGGTVPNYYVLGNSTLSGTLTVGNNGLSFGNGGATGAAGATTIAVSSTNGVTFNSTTDNTYSGAMSGGGGLIKLAANTLTLTGSNTYTGNTTISTGTLVLATNGSLKFVVTGSSNNRITGSGAMIVNGAFNIDTSAVTASNGIWTLVDATNVTYGSSFAVSGSGWTLSAGVWTKATPFKTWTFTPASGVLALATPTSLFVSPSGSDTNPGTLGAPMQTLAATVPLLSPGNTLYLRAGTYRETLNPTTSGSLNAPITIAAYGNETAVITGCDQLTGAWTLTGSGIYSTSVGWDLTEGYNQVFVDGTMQHEAQYPNWTGTNTLLNPPTKSVTVYTGGRINSSSFSGQASNFYAGSRFCGRVGAPGVGGFAWQTAVITSSSSSNLYADTTTESNFWWPEFSGNSSEPGIGFVYGTLNLLDADGEWYLQTNAVAPNTLYLRITGSANPSAHLVEVKHRNWCITLTNCNYVTVSGVQTRGGAIQISGTGNVLDNCDAGYLSHFMTWADANNNPGGNNTEGRGISVSGTNNTVSGCTVHDTSGSGITLTGNGALVTRNHIYNTDYSGTYAASLFVYSGADDIITFNTMHDTGRDVLRPFGSGLSVMYNELYNASILCMDAGVIYAISVDGKDASGNDTRIAYNWLHDIYNPGGDYRSPHIYFDRYCQNFLVDHNVCWNNSGDNGIRLNWPNMRMRCYNNTLFKCSNFGAHDYKWTGPYKTGWTGWTSTLYPEYLTNNLYLSSTPQTQLVNWANDDFRLLSSAAAINTGSLVSDTNNGIDITYGYVGAKPDLGAYEYAGPFWQPGIDGWAVEQPELQGAGANSVSSTNATCFGTLVSTGLSPATVQLFWGLADGGTSTGGWANQMTVNTGYTGNFISVTQSLSGLASGTLYYFRFRATNANGESWTNASTFQTIPNPTILLSWSAGSRTNLNVQIATLTGFAYKLESTTSLLPPVVWTPVSTNAGTGTLMTNTVVVAPSAKTMFFHYLVTPQ